MPSEEVKLVWVKRDGAALIPMCAALVMIHFEAMTLLGNQALFFGCSTL